MTRLRYGIIGAGYMAKLHSLALRNVGPLMFPRFPDIELVRMADIDHDAAIAGAKRWGWAEASDDPASVTRGGDIDVVIVITPNDSHATYGIDALAHGKHLVCEKPLANTVADALRLAEAARKSDRVSMVNFVYRAWPGVELARELIAAGELGELVHFQGHFFQDYAADPTLGYSWRFDKAVAGGGAFADIGSHIMDIACTLMGPVRSISARSKRLHETRPVVGGRPYDVDDVTASLVEFRNGAHGSVHASWAATGHKTDIGFEVIGTRGSLSFNWERNNELHFFSASDSAADRRLPAHHARRHPSRRRSVLARAGPGNRLRRGVHHQCAADGRGRHGEGPQGAPQRRRSLAHRPDRRRGLPRRRREGLGVRPVDGRVRGVSDGAAGRTFIPRAM